MRRPNRNIEIFSISALDLFASALGAFILVAIILFPYYLKDQDAGAKLEAAQADLARSRADATSAAAAQEEALRQARDALARTEASLADAQNALAARTTDAAALRKELDRAGSSQGKPFLVVGVRWTTPAADVDLHVTDPEGHEFTWFKNNAGGRDFPGSGAELSYDMTSGPAVELWQDPAATPGPYTVDYVANALPDGYTVDVFGTVFDHNGRHDLPVRTLRKAKERLRGATITVGGDGRVAIR